VHPLELICLDKIRFVAWSPSLLSLYKQKEGGTCHYRVFSKA
jgi:hypothetical protein